MLKKPIEIQWYSGHGSPRVVYDPLDRIIDVERALPDDWHIDCTVGHVVLEDGRHAAPIYCRRETVVQRRMRKVPKKD